MKIPGFTAEASLYKMSGHYQRAGTIKALSTGKEVVPQMMRMNPCAASCKCCGMSSDNTCCNICEVC